jgi:hypothetical protein
VLIGVSKEVLLLQKRRRRRRGLILEDEFENLGAQTPNTLAKLLGHRRRAEAMWGFQAAGLECLPLWLAV